MNPEEYDTWLSSLKVGDQVCVEERYYTEKSYYITKVISITPKKWIKIERHPHLHFKAGVWNNTSKWCSDHRKLIPITQTVTDAIEYENALSYITSLNFHKLSPRQIKAIWEITKPNEEQK